MSVAGVRQTPAQAIKKGLASKLAVPFIIALQRFSHLIRGDYSTIVATLPEPTVRPPSRISDSVIWGVLAYLPPLYSSYSPHNHDIFVVY